VGVCGGQEICGTAVTGLKLIVVDKLASTGSAKMVYVAKDQAIDKGPGNDVSSIAARLDVAFDTVHGTFVMPGGLNWLLNEPTIAKYVNTDAPISGAVKVGIIKPSRLIKVVSKSLGEALLDVGTAPAGPVYVAHTVTNGPDERRHCTQFTGCVHTTIAGGTGFKLVCKDGMGDASCAALR
jgi:hypothetical protein